MWRAYGGRTGVALVVQGRPFLTPSDALDAYTSPVLYLDAPEVEQRLVALLDRVEANSAAVRAMGREQVQSHMFAVFRAAVLCTKRKGFWVEWTLFDRTSGGWV
jgi:hypothetical protein